MITRQISKKLVMCCTLTLVNIAKQAFINSPILRYKSIGQSFHHTCHTSTKHKCHYENSVTLCVNRAFPKVDDSGNVENKGLTWGRAKKIQQKRYLI